MRSSYATPGNLTWCCLTWECPIWVGLEVCRRFRQMSIVPIIFLSAIANITTKVEAFQCGADDFISEERYQIELVPRMQAVLRRYLPRGREQIEGYGPIRLHVDTQTVFVHHHRVPLTPQERDLLVCLLRRVGRPVDKETLSREVWHCQQASDGQIQSTIRRLREKIEPDPSTPQFIHTVHGVGYQLL